MEAKKVLSVLYVATLCVTVLGLDLRSPTVSPELLPTLYELFMIYKFENVPVFSYRTKICSDLNYTEPG